MKVQFVGGPHDGRQMDVPELTPEIRMPDPDTSLVAFAIAPEPPETFPIAVYQLTGEAADEPPHARLYRFASARL